MHCKAEGPYKEMIGGHLDKCPDLMVPCPNSGCEVSIKRKDMASHHLECPHETISCPYKDVGCTYTSPSHTMADHKATSCGHHLDLAMVQLKEAMVQLKKQGEEIRQLKNEGEKFTEMYCTPLVIKMSQFSQLKVNDTTWYSPGFYTHTCGYKMCLSVDANGRDTGEGTYVSVFLRLMKGENDDTLTWPIRYKCTITLLNQLKNAGHHTCIINSPKDHKATTCGHHLDLAKVQLKDAMVQLKDVKVQFNYATVQLKKHGEKFTEMHCTPLLIKMSQFSQLKVNNNLWHSPGFYTHAGGYKMYLYIHANGCGDGKGTHVSVFLRLMKGENDDTLTWPIRYKCTITLLNQLKNAGHHTCIINSPKDEDDIDCISRVLSGEKHDTGWGFARFIAHTKLDHQGKEQCQYLKDNSLYFRIQVELIPAFKSWLVPTVSS